jgi:predicted NBD/HSP70 family sugar kinase
MGSDEYFFISGNAKLVRNINRGVILNVIRELQPISRSEIARLTGLNKSTVSSIVSELLEEELIFEEEWQDKKIGRNPINLKLKLGRHFVGAINFDVPDSIIAIADIDGSFVSTATIYESPDSPEKLVKRCLEELKEIQQSHQIQQLCGIGITIAGIVDQREQRVHYAPRLGWENFRIGKVVSDIYGDGAFLAINNDAKAATLAELWFAPKERKFRNFVYVYVGDGVGAGIVLDRDLVDGEHNAAGEFGHTTIIEGGELCSCGNYGCWEAYASNPATIKRYLVLKRQSLSYASELTIGELIRRARAGEEEARETLVQTGHYLGLGIANILKAVDPQAVVLGGEIAQAFDLIYPEMKKTISRRTFFGLEKNVQLYPSSLKGRPQLIGAATLAISELFTDYRIIR